MKITKKARNISSINIVNACKRTELKTKPCLLVMVDLLSTKCHWFNHARDSIHRFFTLSAAVVLTLSLYLLFNPNRRYDLLQDISLTGAGRSQWSLDKRSITIYRRAWKRQSRRTWIWRHLKYALMWRIKIGWAWRWNCVEIGSPKYNGGGSGLKWIWFG